MPQSARLSAGGGGGKGYLGNAQTEVGFYGKGLPLVSDTDESGISLHGSGLQTCIDAVELILGDWPSTEAGSSENLKKLAVLVDMSTTVVRFPNPHYVVTFKSLDKLTI